MWMPGKEAGGFTSIEVFGYEVGPDSFLIWAPIYIYIDIYALSNIWRVLLSRPHT